MAHPDDMCQIDGCNTIRADHGDKRHKFSEHGELIAVEAGPPAQNQPPKERGSNSSNDTEAIKASFAALVEVLAEKNILNTHDIVRIFSARH
jgi:hypothetical protein